MMTDQRPPFPSLDDDDADERPPERDALYRALVDTATALYGAQGYRDTPLDQILETAGVEPKAFQARFLDSEDLFCAVHTQAFEDIRQAMVGALQNLAGGPEAIARRGLSAFYRHLKTHPAAARALFIDALRVGPRADALYLGKVNDFGILLDLLVGSLYEAELPEQDYQRKWAINSLMGAVATCTHLWILEGFQTPEEALVQTTYGLFRAAIRQWLDILRLDRKITAARQLARGEDYVSLGYVLPLLDYLRELRQPVHAVLTALGLEDSDLGTHNLMLPASRETAAFRLAESLTGDAALGLHVGERLRLSCLGIVGHLLMTCTSIEEALVLYKRFGLLIRGTGQLEQGVDGDRRYLTLARQEDDPPPDRQRLERLLAGLVAIGRELAGRHFGPAHIAFPFPPPPDRREAERVFGCTLAYDADALRCYFTPAMLRLPLPGNTPELRQALEAEATRQLHALSGLPTDADPRLAALKTWIADRLKDGVPELGIAAQALSTSPRNLQRLLEARRTHYSEVIDEVRRDLAVMLLKKRELSLVDIASELGFGDQSSFNRAFKRWFNSTPSEYRKLQF